jgi:DNA polymerase-3 subunit alpha
LLGVERALSSLTDCSVAGLFDDAHHDGAILTVGGLVTGVQRKITKTGASWAIVTLEDLDGGIEVMVFPQTYNTAGPLIGNDAILVVKGRLDKRDDDTPRFVAMEVTAPDLSDAPTGPVVLRLPVGRVVPPLVEKLRELLATHPGTTEVHLQLINGGRTTVLRLGDGLRVNPGPALFGDLKALLGSGVLL